MYHGRVLKIDGPRFSKFVLQLRVHGTRFDRITERVRNGKAVCCFPACFLFCAYIKDCHYGNKSKECETRQEKLLPSALPPYLTFEQMTTFSHDHPVDPYLVVLQAKKRIHPFEEHYLYYGDSDFATSVQYESLC